MTVGGEVADRFYRSFSAKDPEAMAACYAGDVVFSDPVFGTLRGAEVGDMWRMLIAGSGDLVVEHDVVFSDDQSARVDWTAHYTFSPTGRQVTNRISASMSIRNDEIFQHHDRFSMYRWSAQALGPIGRLAGWSPLVAQRVRGQARRSLERFRSGGEA
jgi:ketosteroid isomerase-like protein